MQVIFNSDWFAPSQEVVQAQGLKTVSGEIFRKSDRPQFVPDELLELLPKSVEILGGIEDEAPMEIELDAIAKIKKQGAADDEEFNKRASKG